MAVNILLKLNLISVVHFNNISYYRKKQNDSVHGRNINTANTANINDTSSKSPLYNTSTEMSKFKRITIPSFESILRKLKLIQSNKLSGEDEKLVELIEKWENVSKEVVNELYNNTNTNGNGNGNSCGSFKEFVKELGFNWDIEDDEDCEGDENGEDFEVVDSKNERDHNKRIKYQD